MTNPIYRTALRSMLALVASLVVGCAVDAGTEGDEPGAPEAEGAEGPAESVGEVSEELSACYEVHRHGGDAFERDYQILLGCSCGPGFVRDFHNVWNNGHGSCNSLGWASPDPNDCRVRVNVHNSAAFLWGECNVQVEKKPLCPHDKCTTGAALSNTACGAAVTSVCSGDPFCCNNSWDALCVNEVQSIANNLTCASSRGTCGHTLCTTGVALTSGCDTPPATLSCVASVCAADPYCCSTAWDGICVNKVQTICGKNCN